MEFSLKQTSILQAARLANRPVFRFARFIGKAFLIFSIVFFIFFSVGIVEDVFIESLVNKFLAAALFFSGLGLTFWELGAFFSSQLAEPALQYSLQELTARPDNFNLAGFLDLAAAKACSLAQKNAKRQKLSEPTTALLIASLIKSNLPEINFIIQRAEINPKQLLAEIKKASQKISTPAAEPEPNFKEIVFQAGLTARKNKKTRITSGLLLAVLAKKSALFSQFLEKNDLAVLDIENLALWYEKVNEKIKKEKKYWLAENLAKRGSLASDWASGFSITLDKYSTDLRKTIAKKGSREIIGHQTEIKKLEEILSKEDTNNALLVGQPGVGRKSIIEAVAQKAFSGQSSEWLNHKRFLDFDPSLLAARITSQEEAEAELDRCLAEAVNTGNIVLFINDFHRFAAALPKPGELNICGILARYLPLSSLQIVALTSYDGLHNILERNSSLINLFEKIEVGEVSQKETLLLLENYLPFLEKKYKKTVSYKALREVIELSDKYLKENSFPQKALRLLDEALIRLAQSKSKEIMLKAELIKKVVEEKTEIPLTTLETKEKSTLLNLEKLLHQRVINQDEAVYELASALRRARAEVRSRQGPIGTFLFLGPTGVGKTETSKALASIYFGSEKRLIRLDMSEFQNLTDIARLIGSYEEQGLLTTAVRENPFSLVLLDEIEKAHPNILNLFLQVLDEGFLTDGAGRKIDFKSAIIISTSNAGADIIWQDIRQDKELNIIKDDLLDYLFRESIFRPEFINRFDAVVVFKPLTKENLLQIAFLMLKSLSQNLKDKGINLLITPALAEKIVQLSYNPLFGAREMRRVIQDKVENALAKAVLEGRLPRGSGLEISPDDFSLKITRL